METLTWNELRKLGKNDKGNRWFPNDDVCAEYIQQGGYRSPSRAWPYSYAKPLMTKKFIKWVTENHPEWAV